MAVTINHSVGNAGENSDADVSTIGEALVSVGPDNGGIFAVPLTLDALGEAIASFQATQGLMDNPDGRVDPGGRTLRRINAALFPDELGIVPLANNAGLSTSIDQTVLTPNEPSLSTDFEFAWEDTQGRGQIRHFQLNESVVPRWFGAIVPDNATDFSRVHIFFHPTPAQAGHDDKNYDSLGSFKDIFHFLTDRMGALACAANTNRILIMPLLTQAASSDCGVFPDRWGDIVGCILGRLALGVDSGSPYQTVNSVVVSSFSSGISYSHAFRANATLGSHLAGVIDFDGVFSSFSALSLQLTGPGGHVVKAQQSAVTPETVSGFAAQNVFPLPLERWSGTRGGVDGDRPFDGVFDKDPKTAQLQIHGTIPQTLMRIAAERAG